MLSEVYQNTVYRHPTSLLKNCYLGQYFVGFKRLNRSSIRCQPWSKIDVATLTKDMEECPDSYCYKRAQYQGTNEANKPWQGVEVDVLVIPK